MILGTIFLFILTSSSSLVMGMLRSLSLTPTYDIQKEFLGHFCKHSFISEQKVSQEPQKTTLQVLLVKMGTHIPQPITDKEGQDNQSGSPLPYAYWLHGAQEQKWVLLGMTVKNAEQASSREKFHACLLTAVFFLNW